MDVNEKLKRALLPQDWQFVGDPYQLCQILRAEILRLQADAWNNRDHLTDLLTNAIDDAIRHSKCSSYSEWQALIHQLLTSQKRD